MNYIDLFAGASGMSEGFTRSGFNPVAHVEMNPDACNTIRTRIAYHFLKSQNNLDIYYDYISGNLESREALYNVIPRHLLDSVINETISAESLNSVFKRIDYSLNDHREKKIDLIIGGPPCQAYSLVGRSRDPNRMKGDKRNYLFLHYAEFLKRYKPKFFVFENVLGLLTAGNKIYLNQMLELFKELQYSTDIAVLNAEDYGVLQKRRRIIIIGRRGKRKFQFPFPVKFENNWQTRKDLFSDLPALNPGQEMHVARYEHSANDYLRKAEIRNGINFVTQHVTRNHNQRDLEIYSIAINKWLNEGKRLKYTELPENLRTHRNTGTFLDRYKVIDPFGHSHTVVAHIAKDGHYYIYPDPDQVRSISVREAARLQSFPDNFYFEGGRTAAFRQIGNAVPPLMASAIAEKLKGF